MHFGTVAAADTVGDVAVDDAESVVVVAAAAADYAADYAVGDVEIAHRQRGRAAVRTCSDETSRCCCLG